MIRTIVRDSSIVLVRELRPTVRDPFTVIFSLFQPLILLALFGPLRKGVPEPGIAATSGTGSSRCPGDDRHLRYLDDRVQT